jgi:hypothetical protein
MEAICSSETSVATQRTTRRYILEDDTLELCGGYVQEIYLVLHVNYLLLLPDFNQNCCNVSTNVSISPEY